MMVLDLEILGGASTSGPLLLADRWQQEESRDGSGLGDSERPLLLVDRFY